MKSTLTTTLTSFFILVSVAITTVGIAQPTYAAGEKEAADANNVSDGGLKCSILPQSICNMAKNDGSAAPDSSNSAVLLLSVLLSMQVLCTRLLIVVQIR